MTQGPKGAKCVYLKRCTVKIYLVNCTGIQKVKGQIHLGMVIILKVNDLYPKTLLKI